MITIELNSADALRRNWNYIIDNNLLAALLEEGAVELAFEAAINGHVEYRMYDGRADVRAIYRAYGETIATASEYQTIALPPAVVHQVAGLVIASVPEVVKTLVTLNGGTMPAIREPIIPTPPIEPEPTPEPPATETPIPEPEPIEPNEPVNENTADQ